MIVPQYWAEGRAQHREKGRQITVRRFGWSDASQEEAQANADDRAREALRRLVSGERLLRREPKVPYNGAEGVPIREEIVAQYGATIITRNSYGARCLNTPNALFADLDFESEPSCTFLLGVFAPLLVAVAVVGWQTKDWRICIGLTIVALVAGNFLATGLHRMVVWVTGGAERRARRRIDRFLEDHRGWNLRVYRTPAGFRVLATHQTFEPSDPAVAEFFQALATDRVYVQMCLNQQCFRARVSAKPWRIGIRAHMRPRPGVWPVSEEHLPRRAAWIAAYEEAASQFAACAFVEAIGSGIAHPEVRRVQQLHDELCKATRQLPIA